MGHQGGAGGPSGKEIRVSGSQLQPSPKKKKKKIRGGHGPSITPHYPSSPAVGQRRAMTRAAFGESRWQYGDSQANMGVRSVVEEPLRLNIPPSPKSCVFSNRVNPEKWFFSLPGLGKSWGFIVYWYRDGQIRFTPKRCHTTEESRAGPYLVMAWTCLQSDVKKLRTERMLCTTYIYVIVLC